MSIVPKKKILPKNKYFQVLINKFERGRVSVENCLSFQWICQNHNFHNSLKVTAFQTFTIRCKFCQLVLLWMMLNSPTIIKQDQICQKKWQLKVALNHELRSIMLFLTLSFFHWTLKYSFQRVISKQSH